MKNNKENTKESKVISALGRLIAKNPVIISRSLRSRGVRVSPTVTNKALVGITIKQLGKDAGFRKDVSKKLVELGYIQNFDNATGVDATGGVATAIGGVANLFGSIFDKLGAGKDRELAEDQLSQQTLLAVINQKIEQDKREGASKRNTLLLVGGIVVVIFIIVGIIIFKKIK